MKVKLMCMHKSLLWNRTFGCKEWVIWPTNIQKCLVVYKSIKMRSSIIKAKTCESIL